MSLDFGESEKKEGPENPRAFPSANYKEGMSLKDWFAGKIAAEVAPKRDLQCAAERARLAKESYWLAGDMLVERERIK